MDKVWPWFFHVSDDRGISRQRPFVLDVPGVHSIALLLVLGQVSLRGWMHAVTSSVNSAAMVSRAGAASSEGRRSANVPAVSSDNGQSRESVA